MQDELLFLRTLKKCLKGKNGLFFNTYAYSKVEHVKFWSICSKLDHVVFLSMLKVGPCCIL